MRKVTIVSITATAVAVLALFILPRLTSWAAWPYVIVIGILVALILLVRWHAGHVGYVCPACDYLFVITPLTDFLSPQAGDKLLRCPRCTTSSWCREIERRAVPRQNLTASAAAQPLPTDWFLHIQIFFVLAIYLFLWGYTLITWMQLPPSASSLSVLRIPISMTILPAAQATFCLFAIRHGYKSRIYLVVTGFVAILLIMSAWAQVFVLARLK